MADNLNTKNDWKWTDWLDSRRGRCTQNSGTVPACPDGASNLNILLQHLVVILYISLVCSGHGIIDGNGKDSFCLCFPGWQGTCCDQPDCGCQGEGLQDCSGRGVCVTRFGESQPQCSCQPRWLGQCCDRRERVRRSGDPHLTTVDGTHSRNQMLFNYH